MVATILYFLFLLLYPILIVLFLPRRKVLRWLSWLVETIKSPRQINLALEASKEKIGSLLAKRLRVQRGKQILELVSAIKKDGYCYGSHVKQFRQQYKTDLDLLILADEIVALVKEAKRCRPRLEHQRDL